jgi:hypothetical protein
MRITDLIGDYVTIRPGGFGRGVMAYFAIQTKLQNLIIQ